MATARGRRGGFRLRGGRRTKLFKEEALMRRNISAEGGFTLSQRAREKVRGRAGRLLAGQFARSSLADGIY